MPKKFPSATEIYEMYNYENFPPCPKENLEITEDEWSRIFLEQMLGFQRGNFKTDTTQIREDGRISFISSVAESRAGKSFVASYQAVTVKKNSKNLIPKLSVQMNSESLGTNGDIGQMIFLDRGNGIWEVNDRIVAEKYRGQGIAQKLLEIGEAGIRKIRLSPVFTATVAQPSVLSFFLKNGYKAASLDDEEKIKMLANGDSRLCIRKCPTDTNEEERRQGRIFLREDYPNDEVGQKLLWGSRAYIDRSFRIYLQKRP